ncbi:MAG: hypothetical protein KJN85_12285 [Maribacter sp.]|nr:hypothetical protein [Maribacter sp.]
MKKTIATYLLMVLIAFQIISAIPAGWAMFTDPSGMKLGIPLDVLELSPFPDFLIPGLFLFIFLGLLPVFILYGLITRKDLKWAQPINLYKNQHWSLTFAYYLGLLLVLWINMQLLFIQKYFFLQVVFSLLGIVIVFLTHLPKTKQYYTLRGKEQ